MDWGGDGRDVAAWGPKGCATATAYQTCCIGEDHSGDLIGTSLSTSKISGCWTLL